MKLILRESYASYPEANNLIGGWKLLSWRITGLLNDVQKRLQRENERTAEMASMVFSLERKIKM
jgi:hypothetical protein